MKNAITSVLVFIALTKCQSVAGRLRPVWSPSFGDLTTTRQSVSPNLEVLVLLESGLTAAPGVQIIAVDGGGTRTNAVSGNDGRASLALPPGKYVVTTSFVGFANYHAHLIILPQTSYQLRVVLAWGNLQPVM